MALRKPGGYPLSAEDERPQSLFAREAREARLERQGCVIKLVLLLCLLLTGVTGFLGYRALWGPAPRQQASVATESGQRLESLESSFSNMSIRQARLEDALTKHTDDLTARTAGLEQNLKMVEAALYELGASKIDRRDLATHIQAVEEQIAGLAATAAQHALHKEAVNREIEILDRETQQQLQVLADQLADVRSGTQAVVDDFTGAVQRITKALADMSRVRSDITELRADLLIQTETKADKSVVDASLEKLQSSLPEQTQKRIAALETRLREIQSQVDELKMR